MSDAPAPPAPSSIDAVVKTAQLLAHDVRKPFTLLKTGLELLHAQDAPEPVRRVVRALLPEVRRAIMAINRTLGEIAQLSSSVPLALEATAPEALIEAAVCETFRERRAPEVRFHYDLAHAHMAHVDPARMLAAISYVLEFLATLVGRAGTIWFETRERAGESLCLELAMGARMPEPSELDPEHVFEPFAMPGGRRLGGLELVLARKIVEDHGGRIACRISAEQGISLCMTLAGLAEEPVRTTARLPRSGPEASSRGTPQRAVAAGQAPVVKARDDEAVLEQQVQVLSRRLGRRLKLLVADDEALYMIGIEAKAFEHEEMRRVIEVFKAQTSDRALAMVDELQPDVVIFDVVMGPEQIDGIEAARSLRLHGYKGFICLHSNRSEAEDRAAGSGCGASCFLPKPMSRAQLLRILVEALAPPKPRPGSAEPVVTTQ
jgi:CheY-like chemotaxis protein